MKLQALIEQNVLRQAELEGDRSASAREELANLKREFDDMTVLLEKEESMQDCDELSDF